MDLQLKGRRALVTGATAGIGRAVALSLAAEGVELALVGRRHALLQEVATLALQAGAGRAVPVEIDMMESDAPRRAAQAAMDGLAGIDILMNCMGASQTVTLDADDAVWEHSMTLNWTRQRQLTHRLLPGMQQRGWGRVLNVTGPNETTGLNAAAVAKAAVHAWAKGVSDLVAADGVTVNCIGPGKIDSEQMRRLYTDTRRESFARDHIPVGRFGEAAELADLAVFLASPRAAYITGGLFHVDGGLRRYMY